MNLLDNSVFLARQVAREPNVFVGLISRMFGFFVDFIFNIVYAMSPVHSLGFTIIIVTIIFRACLLPTSLKAQKSMRKMQELKPELDKIQAKYGSSKDPEIIKKMNAEKSALMAKHGANPLKGCFPMLLQMPLFIGLNFIIQQSFLYINRLGSVYYDLAVALQRVPGINHIIAPSLCDDELARLPANHANVNRLIPQRMLENAQEVNRLVYEGMPYEVARAQVGDMIYLNNPVDLSRVLNRFTVDNWLWLQEQIPAYYWTAIAEINERRQAIESFFGLSMIEPSGWGWPSIIIPALVTITMFCSMWIGNQRNVGPNTDEKVVMQQRMMIVIMPLFLGFITVGFPAGLGLFWITGQVFQGVTDFILLKKAGLPLKLPFVKKEAS